MESYTNEKKFRMSYDDAQTYSQFYNSIYKSTNRKLEIKKFIEFLKHKNIDIQNHKKILRCTNYFMKIRHHCTIGEHITDQNVECINTVRNKIHLLKKSCARRIQSKVLYHLWKPGGTFHNKSIKQLSGFIRD